MDNYAINSLLYSVVLTLLSSSSFKHGLALSNQETDRLALLAVKDQLDVGGGSALSSWNASLHFCQWQGVGCGRRHRRVISLEVMGLKSGGSLPSSVGNLTFLRKLNLSNNALKGAMPRQLGQLRRLRILDLSNNNLQGEIPIEITNCSNLQHILLYQNNLTGEIPFQIGDMKNLLQISVSFNNLVGAIPSSFGNLSALHYLFVAYNHLEGGIRDTLGRLSSLKGLVATGNNLSGTIPPSIYNLSSLIELTLASNQLIGRLLTRIDLAFPNLESILIGGNQFTGTIMSLSNISSLREIDISRNRFRGSMPNNLGNLKNLQALSVSSNYLGSGKDGDLDFISSLTNCSMLNVLSMSANSFGGVLPDSVANLSTRLSILFMGDNQITGRIPEGIGNLVNLNSLDISNCFLQGNVPSTVIGKLGNLEGLFLELNNLSGEIPSSIGNLSRLSVLYLDANNFQGGIPSTLGNCKKLQKLGVSVNKLATTIPSNLFGGLQSLILLNLEYNSFSGLLPSDLSSLKNLVELYISNNNFFGEIPNKLGEASGLRVLSMWNNSFQGNIPQSFGSLKSLENLDLSNNNLSGTIPYELEKLPFLVSLNLSFNQLEGEVPKQGVFKNVSGFSFVGNTKLCGGIPELELPKCFVQEQKKKGKLLSTKIKITIILSILIASVSIIVLLVYLLWRRKFKKGLIETALFGDGYLRLSYTELLQATQGFASSNLIGVGSFGSVYKGVIHQQKKPIAVKVLNLHKCGAAKSFIAECEALSKVRHRNLVKIVTCCSSLDYQGNDFKALVFDFMPNGSLGSWLHEQHESRYLNLAQRLDIAIDVANAIDNLHHDCETTIVHCDLKPTNILLDEDMAAHVGDFGLAKLLSVDTSNMGQTSSSLMNGTIGYIPPEYGMGGAASPEGDIYSYGILLLEMITGRRPTDALFHDGLSLHSFCQRAQAEQLKEIIDFRLLEEIGVIRQRLVRIRRLDKEREIWEYLNSFISIGVACSAKLPSERMRIKDAIKQLSETKARLLQTITYLEKRERLNRVI